MTLALAPSLLTFFSIVKQRKTKPKANRMEVLRENENPTGKTIPRCTPCTIHERDFISIYGGPLDDI